MLKMFVQLLLLTCAYALGAANEVPPYTNIRDSLLKARHLLEENVLSMDGNVPFLNDPRRQYTDIIYVVIDEALSLNNIYIPHDYYKDYQKNINESLPYAIANPEEVIQSVNQWIKDVEDRIIPIQEVIRSVMMSVSDASGLATNLQIDKAVAEEIKRNGEKCDVAHQIYLAAGLFATQLIQDDVNYFAGNSQNLTAHHFILTGAKELELIVRALRNLFELILVQ